MPRMSYYEEVKRRIEAQEPDLSRLMTYREIVKEYGPRFKALGLRSDSPEAMASTLRSMTSRRILRRYEQGGEIKLPANDIETYLEVMEEPRPVA